MKTQLSILLLLFSCLGIWACANGVDKSESDNTPVQKPKVEAEIKQTPASTSTNDISISLADFSKRLEQKSDTLFIYNFWATWCKPCIKELPYFEQVGEEYKDKLVKVVLVSIDFVDLMESSVVPFIKKKGLKSETLLLDPGETKPTEWINAISEEWEGSIPATLVVQGNKNVRALYEQEFSQEELQKLVDKYLAK